MVHVDGDDGQPKGFAGEPGEALQVQDRVNVVRQLLVLSRLSSQHRLDGREQGRAHHLVSAGHVGHGHFCWCGCHVGLVDGGLWKRGKGRDQPFPGQRHLRSR